MSDVDLEMRSTSVKNSLQYRPITGTLPFTLALGSTYNDIKMCEQSICSTDALNTKMHKSKKENIISDLESVFKH